MSWNLPVWPAFPPQQPQAHTAYVFCFLGEFGYELMNWQGVVCKFAAQMPQTSAIVIAGRPGLQPFYETASDYIDIATVPLYRNSIAAAYFALPQSIIARRTPPSPDEMAFDVELRSTLMEYLAPRIRAADRVSYVFSSRPTILGDCLFGVERYSYGRTEPRIGKIYGAFDLRCNNCYRRIVPDDSVRPRLESELAFDLGQPYFLVQTRKRMIGPQRGINLPEAEIVRALADELPVVALAFDTGRQLDSVSEFQGDGARVHRVRSFQEQSCLIAHAHRCIFMSEGDLGSHTYLPPFLGRDVVVVASRTLLEPMKWTIPYWNRDVFNFGGQMIPCATESICGSPASLREAARRFAG